MRTRIVTSSTIALVLALALPAGAGQLDWPKETNRAACDGVGSPIVTVTQRVTGDMDSGFNGGWAIDTYTRRIQVWQTTTDGYCAVVSYAGTFAALAGMSSPGSASQGVLDGDEDGSMQGGYRATITGTLLTEATWTTHGTVGRFDYGCTAPGVCPGAVDWVDQYFEPGYGFSFDFWGWIYRAGRDGTWVNASTGSSGDID